MDRFQEMRVFVAAAEAVSFTTASQKLRISDPTVTRTILALEARLGVQLFKRATRKLSLTEAGSRFLDSSRRLLGELESAEVNAAGESNTPAGQLTISASVNFGRSIVTPISLDFLQIYPRVTASILLNDNIVDLNDSGIDVAVRIGQLADKTLVSRHVGQVQRMLLASPIYLKRHGIPSEPSDLKSHSMIAFTGLVLKREWRFGGARSKASVQILPRLEVNDAVAALNAAEAGEGITIALSYNAGEAIAAGSLVPVLEKFALPPMPVNIVFLQSSQFAAKLPAFLEFATPRLKQKLDDLASMVNARQSVHKRAEG